VFPGGFGVAKNLCSFAVAGVEMSVIPDVEKLINDFHKAGKPIGALCISPVMIAKLIPGAKLTIGQDKATADAVKAMGSIHINTDHTGIVRDEANKIVTTPCYMLDSNVFQISVGAENLMKAILEMM
jgi:enhancing lycopene biosynthesis protein 2